MALINEAYRVLSDPGRRVMYDATLRANGSAAPLSNRGPASSRLDDDAVRTGAESTDWVGAPGSLHPSHVGPARVPWRTLLVCGVLATVGIVVVAQFTEPSGPATPDGILRVGDCVTIDPNNDARETTCAADAGTDADAGIGAETAIDLVVRAFIPFDATCPGRTEPHRDRQGMGIACVAAAEQPAAD